MRRSFLTDRTFYQELRSLMLPIALQSFMLAAVSAGDSAMLGFVDQSAMAAVSQATNIQFVENLFLGGLVSGTTILAAQYWGKKDQETVARIFGLSLRYALAISVLFCLAALALPTQMMAVFTSDPVLIAVGASYVRFAAGSYLLTGVTQCCLCIMKATGQAKESAAISSLALGLDTALNVLFILVFHMGAVGAALTTTISRCVELCVVLVYARRLAVRPHIWGIDREIHRDLLRCGVPVLVNSMFWGIGTALYAVIIGHLGAAITAANAVASIVRQLSFAICQGLGSGGQILLANVLGSGDLKKGRKYGGRLSRLSFLCGVVCGALTLLFGVVLSRSMALSPEAQQLLRSMIWICAFNILMACVNVVNICGIFAAGGDTAFNAYCAAVTMWGIILPLAAAAAFLWRWEPLSVYLILSMDEVVKLPWVCVHYRKYKWLHNMTRDISPH